MAEYKHRKLANSIEIKQSMQQRMQFMEDMERMTADLKQLGFDTETPDRMFSNLDECKQALPVFLKWIELMESTDTTEMLVRYVTVPWAKKVAVQPLIARLKKERNTKNESLKWAIGNALNLTADKSNREELLKIVQDIVYGGARQMIILRLGTMKVRDSEDVLIPLLEQEDVRGHTIAALGYIGSLILTIRIIGSKNKPGMRLCGLIKRITKKVVRLRSQELNVYRTVIASRRDEHPARV
jgi:hypothetical protein